MHTQLGISYKKPKKKTHGAFSGRSHHSLSVPWLLNGHSRGASLHGSASFVKFRPSTGSYYGDGAKISSSLLSPSRLYTPSNVGSVLDMSYGLSMNVLNNSSNVL